MVNETKLMIKTQNSIYVKGFLLSKGTMIKPLVLQQFPFALSLAHNDENMWNLSSFPWSPNQ